ncbi:MAG: HAMP domain-containing histidine kinase [Bacteroidales bacterium]|nr:HAMP domain-containing histidine kinase [Bacteroidales bacterium]MCM1415192.1 HAMP domain-containing histidine kinase [bacterium]MCM1424952.1 HAMP domain-containing histidine kinase [bacterium]
MDGVKGRKAAAGNVFSVVLIGLGAVAMLVSAYGGARLAGAFFLAAGLMMQKRRERLRIEGLTDYLEHAETGKAAILSALGEDALSRLEDEIYKTVTFLYRTREAAVQAKNEFAENLSNIAHQIKTPITAMSLSLQTMEADGEKKEQIERQLLRLTQMEEALLVLSRIDAGTLTLQKKETDVLTLLVLAADNLQELFAQADVSVDIPELEEMSVCVDPEWTMEAVMNLMKNCAEHNAGGCVSCSGEQNPLYTELLIRDDGPGFAREDIPHLFERFYRGKDEKPGGIGIGLALAKEIVERQNGTLRAFNRTEGGACFSIRFYRH